jgi:hypothetical protein
MDQLESNRSIQDIFMDIEVEEEEELPDYVLSFSVEDCHGGILHITQPPSFPEVIPINHSPPSPIVWSNHNFVFHESPQPLVLTKCKDSGVKLEQSMVGESQLIGQVEDKYLATVCGDQLVLWDQHAVHEKIRLEEMMVSTLKRGDSHSLRTVTLESPLLVSLPTEEETLAVLSRSDDCARWGLGLVGTEDTTSRLQAPHHPHQQQRQGLGHSLHLECHGLAGGSGHGGAL